MCKIIESAARVRASIPTQGMLSEAVNLMYACLLSKTSLAIKGEGAYSLYRRFISEIDAEQHIGLELPWYQKRISRIAKTTHCVLSRDIDVLPIDRNALMVRMDPDLVKGSRRDGLVEFSDVWQAQRSAKSIRINPDFADILCDFIVPFLEKEGIKTKEEAVFNMFDPKCKSLPSFAQSLIYVSGDTSLLCLCYVVFFLPEASANQGDLLDRLVLETMRGF